MKRIAIGQILQETNSLNPVLTQRSDFEAYGLVQRDRVVDGYGDVGELAGFGRQGLLQLRWKLRKKPSYRMSAKTLRRLSHVTEIPLQELIGSEGAICE